MGRGNRWEWVPTGPIVQIAGEPVQPVFVSINVLNWRAGQTRANNAIVSLGPSGDIVVHVDQASGTVHLIIDVNGYLQ